MLCPTELLGRTTINIWDRVLLSTREWDGSGSVSYGTKRDYRFGFQLMKCSALNQTLDRLFQSGNQHNADAAAAFVPCDAGYGMASAFAAVTMDGHRE